MTTMLHNTPDADEMETQLQLSQLRYTVSSRAAATSLAENYTGFPVHLTAGQLRHVPGSS
jgi:p-hydroxybenzoate 3-monooxygenase